MYGHWFLVASQRSAKIFSEIPDLRKLGLVQLIENPLGHEKRTALIRKQAGRGVRSAGRGQSVHYSDAGNHDPQVDASQQFAKEVSRFLEAARQEKKFLTLTVVAEPHFLGMLRASMGSELNKVVVRWLNKDLQKTPQTRLSEYLLAKNKEAGDTAAEFSVRFMY